MTETKKPLVEKLRGVVLTQPESNYKTFEIEPDEEGLVERIYTEIYINIPYDRDGRINIDENAVKGIIRSLLQSRQPVVTREEIEDLVAYGVDNMMNNCSSEIILEADLEEFAKACFKSKGVPVTDK